MKRPARPAQAPFTLLGGLSVDEFMTRHWQRRPLLVRQALPGVRPPVDAEGLMALAADDAVESRLVSAAGGRWRLDRGPFEREDLPSLGRKRWTLLVQGVDLHLDSAHELLSRFRFLPDARLDDLMISLASDQGGVGPHLDSYDVFLIQIQGRRRWRVAPPGRSGLIAGLPLKILADFQPEHDWLLEPGDMLYLPPGWGHDGVADGPCMTASVGFRAPSRLEFLREFLAQAADDPAGSDPRFGDAGRAPVRQAAAIPSDLHAPLRDWAQHWRPSSLAIDRFIGRFLSEPKASVWFDPGKPISLAAFGKRAATRGLRLDRRTRMLYRGSAVFINGEHVSPGRAARPWLRRLADERTLAPQALANALARDPELGALLHQWTNAGWVLLGETGTPRGASQA